MKKLQKKIFINGNILAVTGLHIGGTNSQMGIGGPDNLIIRNPLTQRPVIPGSSLKGKMRALLELTKGLYFPKSEGNKKIGDVGNKKPIIDLFGTSTDTNEAEVRMSRLIVRDAELSNFDDAEWDNTDMLFSESKTEVVINRLTSKANPRTFERVPAGSTFDFEMVINIISEDADTEAETKKLLSLLAEGMQLLEDDYLGGNGSRGYGKIHFTNLTLIEKNYSSGETTETEPVDAIKNMFQNFMTE